jgi:putative urate catabolism protein
MSYATPDSTPYPRDLRGYGDRPPHAAWPGDARVAVQFVLNLEEGGEHSVLHGDTASEAFLTEEPTRPLTGMRNVNVESQYEYGTRAGFWRLHRLFTERALPVTVFGVTAALERNPELVRAAQTADWEIASHALRWIDYAEMPEDEEREQIRQAIAGHTAAVGERPTGWYTGRTSVNTRRLVVEEGGFLYDSDSFADDLPYWVDVNGVAQLVIPYTLDNNDGRYVNTYGYQSTSFSGYLSGALDLLAREGASRPKLLNVGLHLRLSGRPGRAADLERFLDLVASRDDVWVTRRVDVARHWRRVHPAERYLPAAVDPLAESPAATGTEEPAVSAG